MRIARDKLRTSKSMGCSKVPRSFRLERRLYVYIDNSILYIVQATKYPFCSESVTMAVVPELN